MASLFNSGGYVRHSAVPTSTVITSGLSLRERTITFATEWFFKPEGVALVKKRLEKELGKKKTIQCEWHNEDCVFRLLCVAGETEGVWRLFHTLLRNIIREEGGENDLQDSNSSDEESNASEEIEDEVDAPIKSNKIQRLTAWNKWQGISNDIAETEVSALQISQDPNLQYPPVIRSYKAKSIWSCQDKFPQVASDQNLRELIRLTGCHLFKDNINCIVFIGSQVKETCDLVMLKLDNILKYDVLPSYAVSHVFYSEGLENFQVSLKYFTDVKKRFFETTLLDNLQLSRDNDYLNLKSAVATRCAIYDPLKSLYIPIKGMKFTRATEEKDLTLEHRDWINFRYSSKGEKSNDPMRHLETPEQRKKDQAIQVACITASEARPVSVQMPLANGAKQSSDIKRWVGDVPLITPTSISSSQYANSVRTEAKPTQGSEDQAKPAWDTYIPYGKDVKVKQEVVDNRPVSLMKKVEALRSLAQHAGKLSQGTISRSTSQPIIQQQVAMLGSVSQPVIQQQRFPIRSQQPVSQVLPSQILTLRSKSAKPVNPAFADDAVHGSFGFSNDKTEPLSILDDDISFLDVAFPLQPIRNSPGFSVFTPIKPTSIAPPMQSTPPSKAENATLRDAPLISSRNNGQPKQESQQQISEVSARKFYQTMNQKAPKPNRGNRASPFSRRLPMPPQPPARIDGSKVPVTVVDPLPEFVDQMKSGFEAMMKNIQGFRGDIAVEVEFGRILLRRIPRRFLTNKETDHSHGAEWLDGLLVKPGPAVFFTKVLTSVPADIHCLVDMKNEYGQEMWVNKPFNWFIKYEFLYHVAKVLEYIPFTIEIDAETSTTQIKTPRSLGCIYTHGIKRHWDYRVVATGFGNDEGNKEKYSALADAIERTLYIPPQLITPVLRFELSDALSSQFQLDGLRVHRISKYRSKDNQAILKVSDIQDLDVRNRSIPDKNITIFEAKRNMSPRKATEKLDFWYEVSISSPLVDDALAQNKLLSLGDEADWTAERFSKMDIAEKTCLPACQMLKQMDGIGYYNDNGIDIHSQFSAPSSAASINPSRPAQAEEVWW